MDRRAQIILGICNELVQNSDAQVIVNTHAYRKTAQAFPGTISGIHTHKVYFFARCMQKKQTLFLHVACKSAKVCTGTGNMQHAKKIDFMCVNSTYCTWKCLRCFTVLQE